LPSHKSGSSLCSSSATGSTTDDLTLISHDEPSSKLFKKPLPCNPSISSSSCSTSVLPSLPIDSTPSLKPNFVPAPNFPGLLSTLQTLPPADSGYNLAHLNGLIKLLTFLQKFPSTMSESTGTHGSKLTNIPPCSTVTPTLDKNIDNTGLIGSKLTPIAPFSLLPTTSDKNAVSSVLKPLQTVPQHSNPCTPILGSGFGLPSVLSGSSCGSFPLPKSTTSGEVPSSTLKTNFEIVSTSTLAPVPKKVSEPTSDALSAKVTEEFPTSVPVPAPTSIPSTLSSHNQAILNQIIKMLLSPKSTGLKPTPLTPSSPILSTHLMNKKNKTSIPPRVQKPLSEFSICSKSLNPSSCLPNDSILPLLSTLEPVTPPSAPLLGPAFTSGVPYGYNPAFMKHLFKQLFLSLPPLLPSSTTVPQSILNITPVLPPISNSLSKSTSDGLSSNFNSNGSSNNSPDLIPTPSMVPITTPKIPPLDSNANYKNSFYNTLLTPSATLKTPSLPSLPSLNSHLMSPLNTTPKSSTAPSQLNPCKSSDESLSDLLSKFLNLTPDPTQPSPGLVSISVTPLPVPKSILEPVKMTIPETDPQPTATSFPCSLPPLFSSTPCRLKHLQLHSPHLPHSSHLPNSPHLLHSPHLPLLPHSLHFPKSPHSPLRHPLSSASELGTGCKH